MIIEWWWLLFALPIFFVLGWWAARIDKKQTAQSHAALPSSYFHGLNFLLNEQSDQAIEAFTQVVSVDPETLELHFALASLFRRRGEIDRAIKIHQNLYARTDLPEDKQHHAQYELGIDFLKAGMFDRAEQLLLPLNHGHYALPSKTALLQVYQQTRMWHEALGMAKQLESENPLHYQALQVHFYCELIEQAHTKSATHNESNTNIQQYITHAQQLNAKHPRLLWLQAQIAYQHKHHEQAIDIFESLYQQGGVSMLLIMPMWSSLLFEQNKPEEALKRLQQCYSTQPSMTILKLWADQHLKYHGQAATQAAIMTWLKSHPSLPLYAQLLIVRTKPNPDTNTANASTLNYQTITDDDSQTEIRIVQQLLSRRLAEQEQFICSHCGFRARQHYWQCPGCHQWDTLTPLALN